MRITPGTIQRLDDQLAENEKQMTRALDEHGTGRREVDGMVCPGQVRPHPPTRSRACSACFFDAAVATDRGPEICCAGGEDPVVVSPVVPGVEGEARLIRGGFTATPTPRSAPSPDAT